MTKTHISILNRIDEHYFNLTSSQKLAAEYLKANTKDVAFCTTNELSKRIGVSEATIVRLARSLSYSSYGEMQKEVQAQMQQNSLDTSFTERLKALKAGEHDNILEATVKNDVDSSMRLLTKAFTDSFTAAVSKIKGADQVYVFGSRASGYIASYTAYFLNYVRPGVRSLSQKPGMPVDEFIDSNKGDVFLVIGMSRYSVKTIEMMKTARKYGLYVIGITDSSLSPVAEFSDLFLACESQDAFFWSSGCVITVINAMLKAMALPDNNLAAERMKRMESLLDENGEFLYGIESAGAKKQKQTGKAGK